MIKPIINGITIIWTRTMIIIIMVTIITIIGASLTICVIRVGISVTLITIRGSTRVHMVWTCIIIIILISSAKVIIIVKIIILRVCPASLVPSVGVVRTLVVVRIRPWFGPIISSPALSVVVFVFEVFEEFGHCLDCFYLAASPRTNYFFVIMI